MVTSASNAGAMSFHGKYAEEEFQFCFHQHWIRLVPSAIRMVILSAIVLAGGILMLSTSVAAEANSRHAILLFTLLFFLIAQFEFTEKLYNYFLYIIIVTDRRIHRIKKTLFITSDQQSIDLWVLQDINKSQHGIVQVFLGFGSLILESQETTLKIHFVPHVSKWYEQIVHLREMARRKWPNFREPAPE